MYYNNKRLALSIFWLVLGLVLVVLSAAEVLNDSVYAGMGAALAVVGGLQLGRHIKYRRDPEYREKIRLTLDTLMCSCWAISGRVRPV